jgi:hypothetical protein
LGMGERELERPGGSYGDELLIPASVSSLSAYQHPRTSPLDASCACAAALPSLRPKAACSTPRLTARASGPAGPRLASCRAADAREVEPAVAACHGAPPKAFPTASHERAVARDAPSPGGGGGLVRPREQPHWQRLSTCAPHCARETITLSIRPGTAGESCLRALRRRRHRNACVHRIVRLVGACCVLPVAGRGSKRQALFRFGTPQFALAPP